MLVGDRVRLVPSILRGETASQDPKARKKKSRERELPGQVIYIHPERRFYTVRFQCAYGSFCESFSMSGG